MGFKLRFSAPVSHQGDMLLIVIPKRLHGNVKKRVKGLEHYLVTIEDF